jgi:hypothetical protein
MIAVFSCPADPAGSRDDTAATVQRYIDTQYERPWRKENGR